MEEAVYQHCPLGQVQRRGTCNVGIVVVIVIVIVIIIIFIFFFFGLLRTGDVSYMMTLCVKAIQCVLEL
jgi:hypothetical protein